jgi:hypothetical protein
VLSLRKSGCETMIGRYWTYLVQFFKMQITRASDYAVRVMVHIAMGSGTDIATKEASVILLDSDLQKIPQILILPEKQ